MFTVDKHVKTQWTCWSVHHDLPSPLSKIDILMLQTIPGNVVARYSDTYTFLLPENSVATTESRVTYGERGIMR